MKLLKIEKSQGYFLYKNDKYRPLDKIAKEDLLNLVDLALQDDATYDEFDEDAIKNQAHQIIYRSIYAKLSALSEDKEEFLDESKRLFLTEYEKYGGPSS